MRTGYALIGLTGGTRPTSAEAIRTATHALTVQFGQPPATEPRFTGYTTSTQPGIRVARYEARF